MILKSNLVMAYLEENEQYGTITEIMIAYSLNKQIAIFIDENIKIEMVHKNDDKKICHNYNGVRCRHSYPKPPND